MTVVTVPASFQAAQRRETIAAAAHAGFDLLHSQLLDEPVAAFIDFLATNPSRLTVAPGSNRHLLVFDFGGGSDIAVLSLSRNASGGLAVAPRSISRFHRLGGGDIDAAIVYEVLLPQLLAFRWGSCNPRNGSIRLNTDLAKKPWECLEYIVFHEMVHLLEPTNNARFVALMDRYMPLWQHHRDVLNRLPVRHELWEY